MHHLVVSKWSLLIFLNVTVFISGCFPSQLSGELITAGCQPFHQYMPPIPDLIHRHFCVRSWFHWRAGALTRCWFLRFRKIDFVPFYIYMNRYSGPKRYAPEQIQFVMNSRSERSSSVWELNETLTLISSWSSISGRTVGCVLVAFILV